MALARDRQFHEVKKGRRLAGWAAPLPGGPFRARPSDHDALSARAAGPLPRPALCSTGNDGVFGVSRGGACVDHWI